MNTKNISPNSAPNSKSSLDDKFLKKLGNLGEVIAARYLQSLGYKILERSWRNPIGEIDVVAVDGEELVLVEVKTRTSHRFGYPEEAVNAKKQRTLRIMAEHYLKSKNWFGQKDYRIDVVAIRKDNQGTWLKHFKNAVGG